MALRRGEAWLTYVANDDAIGTAMVLAASLRRTMTTRKISVIISGTVSRKWGNILREVFDDTFLLDNNLAPSKVSGENVVGCRSSKHHLLDGKIFAFSLQVYDKCIFIPVTALVLENCDELFELDNALDFFMTDLSGNMDLFLFTPNLALCKFLADCHETWHPARTDEEFLTYNVNIWLKNNHSNRIELKDLHDEFSVSKFSVDSGELLLGSGQHLLKIINFVNLPENKFGLMGTLKSFWSGQNGGLVAKTIVGNWLNIFDEHVAGRLVDPSAPHSWINSQKQCHFKNEPIAIIGMSCRFPGANGLDEFWRLLGYGKSGICRPPAFRWRKEHSILGVAFKERETNAGFLSVPVDEFDSKFFGVSPKEAVFLDPQARLLLEVLWESLEDSGIDPHCLHGSHAAIYTGSWLNDYRDMAQRSPESDFFRAYMGNSMSATAARLSFLLGITGPSIATESGCSSAIVAVDLAVKSLRNHESNVAIAGGVNLLLHPFQGSSIDYLVAPDGRCKTFDEKVDGFGRAEGCGVLVLKRLSDALRDRDHVWAMIRGSAISQEGVSRSLGTPTVHSEALAMELALKDAGVRPEQVSFVETHGTGTKVGDPMEVAAIAKVYHCDERKDPLIIGSVKTNVGHTESCSGITGIIKTVLALQHEMIPKHLNFDTLNPEINLDAIPAKIPLEPISWQKVQGQPRIAGVSSFGITGTDGHVVIEEAPNYTLPKFTLDFERPIHLIKFSAKTIEAFDDLLKLYEGSFREVKPDLEFKDVAYSANTGRASFNHRAFLLAGSFDEAINRIGSNKLIRGDTSGKEMGKICFLFTGQGSQYVGMAKTLYETSPVFRLHFDRCDAILRTEYNLSLSEILFDSDKESKELSRTIHSQTSIFCVEYCLLKLWESWGVRPDCVLGHSLGEFCAAVAADILTFQDALKLVAERSRLIEGLPRGSMLVIKASLPEVENIIKKSATNVDFAAINSSEQTVAAGNTEEITKLLDACNDAGVKAVVLEASHAFHSRHMDPMLSQYRRVAETIKCAKKPLKCQYISGMKGTLVEDVDTEITADYWVAHTREKVSFMNACSVLKQLNCQHFVEIGPQPILSTLVIQNLDSQPVSCYPSLRRNTNDWETILTSLGKLYLNGASVDWEGFDRPYTRTKVSSSLPFHPFHRKSFWMDCSVKSSAPIHPLIGCKMNNASVLSIFENNLNIKSVPYLKDHCIGDRIILPGAAFAEMCLSAGYCVANSLTETLERPNRPLALENLIIIAPLAMEEGKICRLQVIVDLPKNNSKYESTSDDDGNCHAYETGFRVKIFHETNVDNEAVDKWQLHTTSTFNPVVGVEDIMSKWDISRVRNLMTNSESLSNQKFYKKVDAVGLKFGHSFKSIERYWEDPVEAKKLTVVAEMKLPNDHANYLLHPTVIDAMIQTVILSSPERPANLLSVPAGIGKLVWLNSIAESNKVLYLYAHWENDNCFVFAADETLMNLVAFMTDVVMMDTTVKTIESVLEQQVSTLPDCWEEMWKPIPGPLNNRIKIPSLEAEMSCEQLSQKYQDDYTTTMTASHAEIEMDRLVFLYQIKALLKMGWSPVVKETIRVEEFCERYRVLPKYHQLIHHYFSVCREEHGWMKFNEETNLWQVEGKPPSSEEVELEIQQLNESLKCQESYAVVSKIYRKVGECLDRILLGEESALELLFPADSSNHEYSADSFYQNLPGRQQLVTTVAEKLLNVFEFIQKANRNDTKAVLRILEVGAGTGTLTQEVLPRLLALWGGKFEYYFTDISSSFFSKAETRFAAYMKNIKFCVFDIEKNGLMQGIPANYFDVVLAADVIHATKNLEQSVRHVKDTLKPGGVLYMTETFTQNRKMTFVFGLLDGYWRFNDFKWRPRHACVGPDTWRQILSLSGFDFIHIISHKVSYGCITAQASEPSSLLPDMVDVDPKDRSNWVVFGGTDDLYCERLFTKLSSYGFNITLLLEPTSKTANDQNDIVMNDHKNVSIRRIEYKDVSTQLDSLLDGGDKVDGIIYGWGMHSAAGEKDQQQIALPFLHISQKLLILKDAPKLFVCTNGVHPVNLDFYLVSNPWAATLTGMVRSLKNENSDLFVRQIDLECGAESCGGDDDKKRVNIIEEILYELALHKDNLERKRVQVAYRDGQRYEPRFCRANLPTKIGKELRLPLSTGRYQLVLPESRVINDLKLDVLVEESVGEMEVEVQVRTYALNFKDILTVLKPSEAFENLNWIGLDFAGVVTKVGAQVSPEKWRIGDRVFGVNTNRVPLNSHLVLDANVLMKIPLKWTYAEACTLPAVFATSIYSLLEVAKMKKGETVLIHTGSGGVGLSAIQIAKHVGANIITTAGSPRKRAYLRSLGIQHVFHSRDVSYREEILRVTQGRGVDIVLNSLTGPGFKEASLDVTGKTGRFLELSKLSVWTEEQVRERRPDVKYSIVDLSDEQQITFKQFNETFQNLLEEGSVHPIPHVKFDALLIRQAMQFLQKAQHIGKVVVTMPEIKLVDGQRKVSVSLFDEHSTYLVTGGLGGIGFEVCKWMLAKGATDVVLIGRNPPKQEIAQEIDRLNKGKKGHNVTVMLGDVGNYNECKAIIDEIAKNCGDKPIRGIQHCAGVLRDNLYANQTWETLEACFNPKVNGTWNLHQLTKHMSLEHFVLYSSVSALAGIPSQSNHAAANCFMDAFAHYRFSLGLPATTINWGQWSQVGCAKEMNLMGVRPVSAKRMLNGLEVTLRNQMTQTVLNDFESFHMWTLLCPSFKYYLDDRLFKSLTEDTREQQHNLLLKSDQFWQEMDQVEGILKKLDIVTLYMKATFRAALRMESSEPIDENANMRDLGVDSLMLIELKNSIQTLMGSRVNVTTNMLKDCHTIRDLSSAIASKIDGENENSINVLPLSVQELKKLLESDCILEGNIRPNLVVSIIGTVSAIKVLLITGVTGQLGPYILSKMRESPYESYQRIVCLVRTAEGKCPREKLEAILKTMNLVESVDMTRVECIRGDIAEPQFGLSEESYKDLVDSVDGVIHLAVKINHVEAYRKSGNTRRTNVEGTLNVLRFAVTGKRKHVFYASTIGCVFGGNNDQGFCEDWPAEDQIKVIAENSIDGYHTSKFVCEMLLKQASERGIPCKVFRFPAILGDSSTGQLNYHNNHYILRLLSYLKTKAIPSSPIPAIILPVDICADLSLKLFWNVNAPNEIYNIVHPNPQMEVEFVEVAKQHFGIDIQLVEWKSEEFSKRLCNSGMPLESLKDFYENMGTYMPSFEEKNVFKSIQGYLNSPINFFSSQKADKYVPGFRLKIPSTMDTIRQNLVYVKSKGFFEKFGI